MSPCTIPFLGADHEQSRGVRRPGTHTCRRKRSRSADKRLPTVQSGMRKGDCRRPGQGLGRLASVYGSVRDHPDRVMPAFCRAAASGAPMHVKGVGYTFDFTHVLDVARGIERLVRLLETGRGDLPPIHIASGRATRLGDLARMKRSQWWPLPDRSGDKPRLQRLPLRRRSEACGRDPRLADRGLNRDRSPSARRRLPCRARRSPWQPVLLNGFRAESG